MQIPETYRAYQFKSYGQKKVTFNPAVKTEPLLPDQVRIKVVSAAVSPVDLVRLGGVFVAMLGSPSADNPFGIGCDAAGVVVEVGNATKRLKVGDQVFTHAPMNSHRAMAEFLVMQEHVVAIKPTKLTFDQAAGLAGVALTSYQAIFEHANLCKGETILILGGSSSTGIMAIQLAHAVGAHVIVTTSNKNAEFVKGLGADQAIDYHAEKWWEVLEPHSVNVVYDCGMEADAWNHHAQSILKKDTGRFVTLLPLQEPVEAAKFGATNVGMVRTCASANDLNEISAFVERGELIPLIDSVYPFEDLQKALDKVKTRHARGKLIVQVNDSP